MLQIRRAKDRGHFDHGWLDTHHTFSFASYHDPRHMGFRALRVMNEDRVHPGQGFGTHGHRDMEIISHVLQGALAHQDSMGNGSTIRPGEFQYMSAGSGIEHSEYNPSSTDPVHFYQIWLYPRQKGLQPGYQQKAFPGEGMQGQWQLIASPDGSADSLTIQQDAYLYRTRLQQQQQLTHELQPDRHAWIQVLRGSVVVNGNEVKAGDGVAVSEERLLHIEGQEEGELLLFDLS